MKSPHPALYRYIFESILINTNPTLHIQFFVNNYLKSRLPIHTGPETDTHAHCIPGRIAGRNDLSYKVNSGKTHCK